MEVLSLEQAFEAYDCSYTTDPVVFHREGKKGVHLDLCYGMIACRADAGTYLYPMLCPAIADTVCPGPQECYEAAVERGIENNSHPDLSTKKSSIQDKYGRACKFSGATQKPTLFYLSKDKERLCVSPIDCGKDVAGPNLSSVGCPAVEEQRGKKNEWVCPQVVHCVQNEFEGSPARVRAPAPTRPPKAGSPKRTRSLYEYITEEVFRQK